MAEAAPAILPEQTAEPAEAVAETATAAAAPEAENGAHGDAADGEDVAEEEAGEEEEEEDAAEADDANGSSPQRKRQRSYEPVKLGYKTFNDPAACQEYFCDIVKTFKTEQNLNEYEAVAVLDLLYKGHHDVKAKVGQGVTGVQVREVTVGSKKTKCFQLVRVDGTVEDFSYIKCLQNIYPDHFTKGHRSEYSGRGRGGASPHRGGRRGGAGAGGVAGVDV